jgi:plasmid stabilization system protein ParE
LGTFPRAGRERAELRTNLRSYPAHPYVIFYAVDDKAQKVVLVRILHGSMDLDADELEAIE